MNTNRFLVIFCIIFVLFVVLATFSEAAVRPQHSKSRSHHHKAITKSRSHHHKALTKSKSHHHKALTKSRKHKAAASKTHKSKTTMTWNPNAANLTIMYTEVAIGSSNVKTKIYLRNNGADTADDVIIKINVPKGIKFNKYKGVSAMVCKTTSATLLTCDIGNLERGDVSILEFRFIDKTRTAKYTAVVSSKTTKTMTVTAIWTN